MEIYCKSFSLRKNLMCFYLNCATYCNFISDWIDSFIQKKYILFFPSGVKAFFSHHIAWMDASSSFINRVYNIFNGMVCVMILGRLSSAFTVMQLNSCQKNERKKKQNNKLLYVCLYSKWISMDQLNTVKLRKWIRCYIVFGLTIDFRRSIFIFRKHCGKLLGTSNVFFFLSWTFAANKLAKNETHISQFQWVQIFVFHFFLRFSIVYAIYTLLIFLIKWDCSAYLSISSLTVNLKSNTSF